MEHVGVNGVWDACHGQPFQQFALSGLPFKPTATGHKKRTLPDQQPLLAPPYLCGKVACRTAPGQILAVGAARLEARTAEREMAYRRGRPNVVHRPHHSLAAVEYLPDAFQRQHALIDP